MKKIFAILFLLMSLNTANAKVQAQTGIKQILEIYSAAKRQTQTAGSRRDISLACMGLAFLDWFNMYTSTIAATPDLPEGSLNNFNELIVTKNRIYDRDQTAFEVFRPRVIGVVQSFRVNKKEKGEFVATPDQIPLDNIHQKDLTGNLTDCLNLEFLVEVEARAPLDVVAPEKLTITLSRDGSAVTNKEDAEKVNAVIMAIDFVSDGGSKQQQEPPELVEVTRTFDAWLMEIQFR